MSYIGIEPSTAAFPFDQFSGNGTTTAFTMSYAPASTTSMVVCISGVVQNPNTYSIVGLTLTFSAAPPTGTNNIAVLYLGIPATSVTTPGNTAYLTTTSFTATGGQTTFTPSATYQVGYINVIRNGSQLAPADFTATNGTTVVLANPCVAGDTVVTQGYTLASLVNALPLTGGTVTGATTFSGTTAFSGTNTFSGASTFTNQVTINGGSASGYTGYKNRIINGNMIISQYNGTSSTTPIGDGYFIDRWRDICTQGSKFTRGQNLNLVTPPSGFSNYLGVQIAATATVGASDYFVVRQIIEGNNITDLNWGATAASAGYTASPVTLSFWVRSNITGTFGGSVQNGTGARSYPFTYTILSANTWEFETITIPGEITGTWATSNLAGLVVNFGLGVGTTFSGTANTWGSSNFLSATGATSLMGSTSNVFYVTGVQLERGSNATSFEFRDYGRELVMCQRYYWKRVGGASASTYEPIGSGGIYSTPTNARIFVPYPMPMRAIPTFSTNGTLYVAVATGNLTPSTISSYAGLNSALIDVTVSSSTMGYAAVYYTSNTTSDYFQASAEL